MSLYLQKSFLSSSRKLVLFASILCFFFAFSLSPLAGMEAPPSSNTGQYSTNSLLPATGSDGASLISVIHRSPPTTDSWFSRGQFPSLNKFVANIENGQTNTIRGVYVPGFFALPVVQQPSGNTGFVSTAPETVTQFQLAARYNVIGFLAHNYLSGMEFFDLKKGLQVLVVNGDGSFDRYQISMIRDYQKVTPGSNWSQYVDLATGERLTTYQVFNQYYQGEHHLTFQTCLAREGIETWGLRFIVAEPVG